MDPNDEPTFGIDRQSGQNISNVGGDQTIYYGDRSRATRIAKVLAAVGLSLSLGGLALLLPVGATTAHSVLHDMNAGGAKTPYTHYLSWGWTAAVGLLVCGQVVKRVSRIMDGR